MNFCILGKLECFAQLANIESEEPIGACVRLFGPRDHDHDHDHDRDHDHGGLASDEGGIGADQRIQRIDPRETKLR